MSGCGDGRPERYERRNPSLVTLIKAMYETTDKRRRHSGPHDRMPSHTHIPVLEGPLALTDRLRGRRGVLSIAVFAVR